jgi:hypothetical protein
MTEKNYSQEEELRKYVQETEKNEEVSATERPVARVEPVRPQASNEPPSHQREFAQGNNLGWQKLKTEDLPTQGLFYPDGTEIHIRAATAGEIRHWSTLNEDDIYAINDMINYVLERCVNVKGNKSMSWMDIKEVDRFYVLLAIREYTFIKGENKLQVKVSENKKVDVSKEMVDYITFDERIMKHYSPEEKCLVFKFKNGKEMRATLPSVGVVRYLTKYRQRKNAGNESYDEDFLSYAPFVVFEWRGLNDQTYVQYVEEFYGWDNNQISLMNEVKNIFADAIDPVVKYNDEDGGQRVIPLSFQGGLKSIFLVSDIFDQLV